MSNSLYFLRHAESVIDLKKPSRDWGITEDGKSRARELARSDVFKSFDGIVHSSENKAIQTADAFAEELDVELYEIPGLDELNREYKEILSNQDYRTRVRDALTYWDQNVPHWESAADGLTRFADAVKKINIMFYSMNVLVISHGIVLTLYFSRLKGFESIAYERWAQLKFLSWGLVRNDRLLIDII